MTKKRYGVYNYSSLDLSQLIDNSTNELFGIVDAVDLLNKYNVGYNQCHSDVLRLEKENEELKEGIGSICREIEDKPTMTTTEVMVKLQGLIF